MLYIFFCLSPDLLSGVLLRERDLRLLDEFLDPVMDKRFWGMKFLSAMFSFCLSLGLLSGVLLRDKDLGDHG